MSKIQKRLQIIANLVNYRNICDVGCDHGKLSEYLLRNNMVDSVIVSDISLPSLNKAIDLLSKRNYNFEYIHCDGLTGYSGKNVDQCVISGMGGDEIIKIISNSPIEIKSYILSPQHNNIEVKKFIISKGYNIDYDIIIKDKDKFYNIFRCVVSNNKDLLTQYDLYFGKANFESKDSNIFEFVESEIKKINKILEKTPNNKYLSEYLDLLKEFNKRNK